MRRLALPALIRKKQPIYNLQSHCTQTTFPHLRHNQRGWGEDREQVAAVAALLLIKKQSFEKPWWFLEWYFTPFQMETHDLRRK